jgi:phosphoribosylamine--glycine ligase
VYLRSFPPTVYTISCKYEHKRLFPGNIDPSTGEMGTSMFWASRNDLFERTLGRPEDWLVAVGTGDTMRAAQREAYERVDCIRVPNHYYRDDIGDRWVAGDGDRLQAWGYLGPA